MTREQAKQLVRETLQDSFDKERFVRLVRNVLNTLDDSKNFSYHGQFIPDAYNAHVRKYERVGKYEDPEGGRLDVLIVYLQRETTLERARTAQRNFTAWYLKRRGEKDAALIAFVSPNEEEWRFSYVKMEYKLTEPASGKAGATEEFTPARRYSFLVGRNENSHTAQSRLVPLLLEDDQNLTLQEIEDTFGIEKVTKEFFEQYRGLFLQLKEHLDDLVKSDDKVERDFSDKQIDQGNFAKKLLGQIVFLYFLQKKGWFGVERGRPWGSGSRQFLRELFERKHGDYANFFNDILEPLFYEALRQDRSHDDDYYSRFDCRIPFLNGGLFDPLGNYDWVNTDLLLPNELFSNEVRTKKGDIGTGILDILDRYNFTVKEDEPLEKEVAVDPEMLGKVFENLLEVKDRKSKGTYYTPREIVHYMCQESLAHYLATGLEGKVSKEDVETLIKYGETVVEHDSRVVQKGKETAEYSFKLPESVRNNAALIDEKLAAIRICDPAVGSGAFPVGMMNEIVRTRNALSSYVNGGKERSVYEFKRDAIQNSLYGVDIDPGAVEIAKLRLWLSLVVDEEDITQIKPLPNLDYKVVQGNSLLSVEKNLFNQQLFDQLEELKPKFFGETSTRKKQEYKRQIDELIGQITKGHKEFDFEVYFSEVFHEKKGFDVVIANPPYDVVRDATYREKYAESIYGRANLYGLFIHQSLKSVLKLDGHLTFINPKTLLADMYFINLRKFLKRNGCFKTILKIEDRHKVFENVLQAVIVYIYQRRETSSSDALILMHEIREKSDIENVESRLAVGAKKVWLGERFGNCILVSDKKEVYSIFHGLLVETKSFHQVGIKFETGKIQWDLFKKQLVSDPMPGSVRLIWAENIQRYRFSDSEKRTGKEFIKGRVAVSTNITKKTIITQRTTADEQEYRIIATIFDPQVEGFEAFSENHTNYMVKCSLEYRVEFVLGLLNSQFFDTLFRHINSNTQVSSGELNSLPIIDISSLDQRPVVNLVNKILAITKDDDYLQNPAKQAKVREYERRIDQLVYKLYGLTYSEIETVEAAGRQVNSRP